MAKILYISHSALSISETFIAGTIQILMQDHEVLVASGSDGRSCAFPDLNVRFTGHSQIKETLPEKFIRTWRKSYPFDERRAKMLKKLVQPLADSFQPDLVWLCYGTTAYDARYLLNALKLPYVIEVHGYDVTSSFANTSYREGFVRLANASKGVICASHHMKRLCVLNGVEESIPHVIRLSLDAVAIKPQGIPKTPFPSLIHFGRLAEKKHPIVTLEAFRLVREQIPEARMTFIGSGHMAVALNGRIERYGLREAVKVYPGMPQREALKIVESHWVFCQHSVTAIDGDQEGFSLSPAEAALLEMPVVSSYHNGIPEHVLQGETGLLVREFDYEGMADAMLLLLEDDDIRLRFGKQGRESVLKWSDPNIRKAALNQLISRNV